MDKIGRLTTNSECEKGAEMLESADGLSRRTVLKTATAAAGAVAGVSSVMAANDPVAAFGAPLVEVHVPAGALSAEQKGAMIKGISDVILGATKLPEDQAKKMWVQIFETTDVGWGVGGQVFIPRAKAKD
jgi:phenylpyruvate tautomerase PptA (4-oxalocrotonate tautomerase family)